MSNRLDVMISSTARDLPDHRQAALDACMSLGLHPVMMEHLPALDADAIDASLKMVDDSTIYLGIFAHRYGYMPNDPTKNPDGLSITELEYQRAVAKGKPRLLFVVADSHTPDLPHEEAAPDKLHHFKDRITQERVVKFFHSADELRGHITQALAHWLELRLTWQPAPPPDPAILSKRGILPPGDNLKVKGWTPNANFVGREADLRAIAQWLLYDRAGKAISVTAAMGTGGIGKTQLAIEFAYRYGRYFYGVHWLSAQFDRLDPEIAACGYPNAMNLLDFPDKQDAQIERVLAEWAKSSPRLLIVDNAEKPEILKDWLPRLQGHRILITSRRGQFPAHWGVVAHRLDVLAPAESSALLCRLAPHLDSADPAELEAIGEKLGHLPLALDLAGNYINFRRMTPADYLSLLDKQTSLVDNRLFTTWASEAGVFSPTDHDLNLYANFDLSWQRLTSDAPKRLLVGCGYLAPNTPIPLDLLTALFDGDADPAETRDMALVQLDNVGLLSRKDDSLPIIHPLIADFARLQSPLSTQWGGVGDGDALAVLANKMAESAKVANETGLPANFTPLRAHVERLAEQAELAGNEKADALWACLGFYLEDLADYDRAYVAYEHALQLGEAAYGQEHPIVATHINNLGVVLRDLGDYAGAKRMSERALQINEQVFGSDSPEVAADLNNLGGILLSLGDLEGAKRLYERLLKIVPENAVNFGVALNNFGSVLQGLGDYAGAKRMYEHALQIDEQTFGPEHPNVARDLNNLGNLLREMGHYEEAKQYLERAVQLWVAVLGSEHPQVAYGVNNIGLVLSKQGDLVGARRMYERALQMDEQVFGSDHPNVARDVNNLGVMLYHMGNLVDAKAYLERALDIRQRFLPAGHPDIQRTQKSLDIVNRKLSGRG